MTDFTEQIRLYEPHRRQPRIAAIGGGHGLSAMLRGLKAYTRDITAIVTVADDGGGSGMLREDLGMLPPGDIRNCIMALANTEPTMQQLLNYRFTDGSLAGQSFGNLFLAAMNGISGSFDEAVHRMGDVLAITGRVLPVTNQDVRLEAEFHDGSRILGESKIFYAKKINNSRIRKVRLVPERPAALPESVRAIREADIVVIGPGSLYTSIIPNFLVSGIADAVRQSRALKIYVLNIMTQDGETDGYDADDHVRAILEHAGTLYPPQLRRAGTRDFVGVAGIQKLKQARRQTPSCLFHPTSSRSCAVCRSTGSWKPPQSCTAFCSTATRLPRILSASRQSRAIWLIACRA